MTHDEFVSKYKEFVNDSIETIESLVEEDNNCCDTEELIEGDCDCCDTEELDEV